MLKKDYDKEFDWYTKCGKNKSYKKETKLFSFKRIIEFTKDEMADMKAKGPKHFNSDFGIDNAKPDVIMQLLQLFNTEYLWIAIEGAEANSPIFQSVKNRNVKHVILTDLSPEKSEYSDIIITEHFNENLVELFAEIIEYEPYSISIYDMNLTLEQDSYYVSKTLALEKMPERISFYTLIISFYESYFTVSFNTEKFSKSEMVPRIEKIFLS